MFLPIMEYPSGAFGCCLCLNRRVSNDANQSNGQNPYAFLFEDPKKPKKQMVPSGNSTTQRIIFVVAGVVVLLLLGVILFTILGRSGAESREELTSVARKQSELIRVANIGATKGVDQKTRSLALTTGYSVTADNKALLDALKKNNITLDKKDLASGKNSATDTKLTAAEKDNNFDSPFTEELTTELNAYRAAVKTAFTNAKAKSIRTALNNAYTDAGLILAPSATTQ